MSGVRVARRGDLEGKEKVLRSPNMDKRQRLGERWEEILKPRSWSQQEHKLNHKEVWSPVKLGPL